MLLFLIRGALVLKFSSLFMNNGQPVYNFLSPLKKALQTLKKYVDVLPNCNLQLLLGDVENERCEHLSKDNITK